MMNLDNYYLHATGGYRGNMNEENKIIDILREGKVTNTNKNYYKSPTDKICLCDTTRPVVYIDQSDIPIASSFENFVLYTPSLVFSRNFSVEIPEYAHWTFSPDISDCYDEVRYHGELSLEHLSFITFPIWPVNRLTVQLSYKSKMKNLEIFKENIEVIQKKFHTVPIKDIYTGKNLTSEAIEKHMHLMKYPIEKKNKK